jgi:hypothetical protein
LLALLLSMPAVSTGQTSTPRRGQAIDLRLHPSALAQLIDQLGGRHISLPRAKVVSVINPRAFLVESAGPLPATPGNYHRVVVLVEGGALRVEPPALVGTTVNIIGVARTVLGLQVTREVPWPPELTRDIVRRYEIRAAVLSSSVETPDGVELVRALELPGEP